MICRVERTRYATLDALEVTDRFTATPGALEADIQICLEQLSTVDTIQLIMWMCRAGMPVEYVTVSAQRVI